ncbi:NAD(P)/FAD-dependent oxidoreductase [Saccharopolyspora cebuensis]|uniref:NAD(P)/FAD-dependent oxidoreductase n=1 Tax=Saccharopolyspora cebuensis TaxID=418759 RepID=A0ABV4CHV2_9PSEU
MAKSETFVIVGAGLAGAKGAEALREQGFDGRIVLLGAERRRPYQRPPLSKGYLMGTEDFEVAHVHRPDWYAEHDVELRTRTEVTGLDRAAHRLALADGSALDYDKLLLTTGARPRTLPVPGAGSALHLRTGLDSERLRATLAQIRRLVVVGAGWLGLEVAAAARTNGVRVSVVDIAELPMQPALGREVGEVFARLHESNGVDFHLATGVEEITTDDGRATGVRLSGGLRLAADAVVVAVGVEPETGLAERAGLRVDDGIVVDSALRTEDPDVVAAGDVANAFHPVLGRWLRVEHWATARDQPATAAATMLGGAGRYAELPYAFTDQYDLGMEYLGHAAPGDYDQVLFRGDVDRQEFIAFWLDNGRVLAGMNVNTPDVGHQIGTLISSGAMVDTARLADPDVHLDEFIAR